MSFKKKTSQEHIRTWIITQDFAEKCSLIFIQFTLKTYKKSVHWLEL